MLVLVSGSTGLVGTALLEALRARGDRVRSLVRREARGADEARWDPAARTIDPRALDGVDAVVHLAGENVAGQRWNEAHKRRVLDSRVDGTTTIAEAIARAATKPRVLVSASAIGFYGNTGASRVDEGSPEGRGFLAEVCHAWEAATAPAEAAGVRVVHARIGVVFAERGGALEKMLLPFKLGVGGRIGDGTQGMSWVALDDVVGGLLHCIDTETLRGPVNLTAPSPVSNADLTRALGRVLHRPTPFPVPGFALRIAAGTEMADEILLGGSYVFPARLTDTGYRFRHPDLEPALRSMLRS